MISWLNLKTLKTILSFLQTFHVDQTSPKTSANNQSQTSLNPAFPASPINNSLLFVFIVPHRLGLLISIFFGSRVPITSWKHFSPSSISEMDLVMDFFSSRIKCIHSLTQLAWDPARENICFWDWQSGQQTDGYSYGNGWLFGFMICTELKTIPA